MDKGQVSIEFLASFFLYLLAVTAVVQFVGDDLPQFNRAMEKKNLHYEARYVSDQMLTQTGYHTFGSGGTNWQKNDSTVDSLENFGLASDYLVVDQDKLSKISTVGQDKLNYSTFRKAVGAENQYKFNFISMPLVETYNTYRKGSPPAGWTEPGTLSYDNAESKVHYGSIRINGNKAYFVVTSHKDRYNTTYVSSDTNFGGSSPIGEEESFTVNGRTFELENIQNNRRYERGGLLTLKRQVKSFGAPLDDSELIIKMNRYVSYRAEGSTLEPMRVEVFAW